MNIDQSLYKTEAFKRYRLKNRGEWPLYLFNSVQKLCKAFALKAFPKTDQKTCTVCSEPRFIWFSAQILTSKSRLCFPFT